jgi:hypothetical protein
MAYNPDASFSAGKSPLSADYDRLYALLVPGEGKCATLEGELLRASSKIYHDYYCNGFGNNWSGAYKFLNINLGLKATERKILAQYARGKICKRTATMYSANDKVAAVLEDIGNRVVNHVLSVERSGVAFTVNTEDMWDLQEKSTW